MPTCDHLNRNFRSKLKTIVIHSVLGLIELVRVAASVVVLAVLLSGSVTSTALYGADLNPVAGSGVTYTLKVPYAR